MIYYLPGLFFSNNRNKAKVIFGMFCNNGSTAMNSDKLESRASFSVIITFLGTVRTREPSENGLTAFRPRS